MYIPQVMKGGEVSSRLALLLALGGGTSHVIPSAVRAHGPPLPAAHLSLASPAPSSPTLTSRCRVVAPVVLSESSTAEPRGPRVVTPSFTLCLLGGTLALISACTLLFARLERWSLVDSFYFTTTTLTTIGFGDVKPIGRTSRLLTSALSVLGVGLLGGLVSATLEEMLRSTSHTATLNSTQQEMTATLLGRRNLNNSSSLSSSNLIRSERRLPQALIRSIRALKSKLSQFVFNPWVQSCSIFGVGVVGFRFFEPCTRWTDASYLVVGCLTTSGLRASLLPNAPCLLIYTWCHAWGSGLGDVVATTRRAKLFISFYSPFAVIMFARTLALLALRPLDKARQRAQEAVLHRYSQLNHRTLDEVIKKP